MLAPRRTPSTSVPGIRNRSAALFFFVTACALVIGAFVFVPGGREGRRDSLGLQAPTVQALSGDRNLEEGPPLGDHVVFVGCDVVHQRVRNLLKHFEQNPVGTDVVRCYLAGPVPGSLPGPNERDGWSAGVMYLPADLDIEAASYGQAIAAGGVDLALEFNFPRGGPPPTEADPDYPSGGYAPFEAPGGDRAVVQQLWHQRVRASWRLDSRRAGDVQVVLSTSRSPEETVELARALRDGPPPA